MPPSPADKARIDRKVRLACVASGIPMILLLFPGVILAGIMPPQSPTDSPEQVAHYYQSNVLEIRFGLALSFFSVVLLLAFGCGLANQIARIPTAPRSLIHLQIAAFTAATVDFSVPWVCWLTAAYRLDRPPSDIALLHDYGWIFFLFDYVGFFAWLAAIGIAVLTDVHGTVYPRWFGYLSLLVAVSFLSTAAVPFFTTGPFAWNGVFAYWIPFVDYGVWIIAAIALTMKAITREEAEATRNGEEPTAGVREAVRG